jgi:NADH-quinone oxidoreductase subunit C
MSADSVQIQDKLLQTFGGLVYSFNQEKDVFSFEANPTKITAIVLFLKNDPDLKFHFLTDLCGIHYPDNEVSRQFSVVYHMHNWYENKRIKIKVFISGENPSIKTLIGLFPSANWMERETWDFYGINFVGHPNLTRILNMDEMVSHPMRKEFPLEDGGRTDKDDRFFGRTVNNS